MIRTILIDDEKHSNESLEIELKRFCPKVNIIATFTDAKKAIFGIQNLRPDLVFLDIEMPWMNGFELLREINTIDFSVIFITAYDNYAIEAFRYSAVDYLLKPVQSELLIEAVARVELKQNNHISERQMEVLLENMKADPKPSKIIFSTSDGMEFIDIAEIIRCKADNNYTHIYLLNGEKILISKSLKQVQSLINDERFVRVHQSHLVNYQFIRKLVKSDGGYLLMKDGSEVSVSKNKRPQLMTMMEKL